MYQAHQNQVFVFNISMLWLQFSASFKEKRRREMDSPHAQRQNGSLDPCRLISRPQPQLDPSSQGRALHIRERQRDSASDRAFRLVSEGLAVCLQ